MIDRDTVGAYIYVPKHKEILLQKKTLDYPRLGAGGWFTFGGVIEKGEDPLEALFREIREELGVEREFFKRIHPVFNAFCDTGKEWGKSHLFGMEREDRDLEDYTIGEGAGIAYFNYEEIPDLNMNNIEKEWIMEFIRSQNDN